MLNYLIILRVQGCFNRIIQDKQSSIQQFLQLLQMTFSSPTLKSSHFSFPVTIHCAIKPINE